MKKYLFLLLLIYSTGVTAQFKLSGSIKNYNGHDELKINIPVVYGFNEANSIKIPVDKDGSFSINLPIKKQKFADLIFQQTFHLLLLTRGKNLRVEIDQPAKVFKLTTGTALSENIALQKANIEEYPFFLQNEAEFTNLDAAGLDSKLVKPYYAMRDKKIAAVNQSAINLKDKKLIASEIKYAAYNNLYELILLDRDRFTNLLISAYDKADVKAEVTPPGPQYYLFANYYVWYKQAKATIKVKTQNTKPTQPMPDYGLTVAQFNDYGNKYGTGYQQWLSAAKFLPATVAEQLGYVYISNAVRNGNKTLARVIADDYLKKFPAGVYKNNIVKKLSGLK